MLRTFWTILGSGKQGVIEDVGVVKRQALPAVTEVEDAEAARSDGAAASVGMRGVRAKRRPPHAGRRAAAAPCGGRWAHAHAQGAGARAF